MSEISAFERLMNEKVKREQAQLEARQRAEAERIAAALESARRMKEAANNKSEAQRQADEQARAARRKRFGRFEGTEPSTVWSSGEVDSAQAFLRLMASRGNPGAHSLVGLRKGTIEYRHWWRWYEEDVKMATGTAQGYLIGVAPATPVKPGDGRTFSSAQLEAFLCTDGAIRRSVSGAEPREYYNRNGHYAGKAISATYLLEDEHGQTVPPAVGRFDYQKGRRYSVSGAFEPFQGISYSWHQVYNRVLVLEPLEEVLMDIATSHSGSIPALKRDVIEQ